MLDLETALFNPSSVFKHPADVLKDESLSREQKIEILQRWAYDEREMAVAEEENMTVSGDDKKYFLGEILKCLIDLGVHGDDASSPPTKQG